MTTGHADSGDGGLRTRMGMIAMAKGSPLSNRVDLINKIS